MLQEFIAVSALSLVVAACSAPHGDSDSSASETTDSAFSTCGAANEACCRIFEPGESGFTSIFCSTGLACTTVGAFQKCVAPGTTPLPGPPDGACGFEGHLCCPSTAVGEDGDHAPHCNATLACQSISGVPTCVNPSAPSPAPAPTRCGAKGQRCCPSPDVGESGSHAPTCNAGLGCHAVAGILRCK